MKLNLKKRLKENYGIISFVIGLLLFRTFAYDWSHIPSGSMEPTLYSGDRVLIDKMALGPTIPFTDIVLYQKGNPERGDIVLFFPSHAEGIQYIKRVVGIPGDTIRVSGKNILVNGKINARQPYMISPKSDKITHERIQTGNISHVAQYSTGGKLPNISSDIIVPEGQYFVMGDHRTHSLDSRYWGFVQREQIVGKTSSLLLSFSDKRSFWDSVLKPFTVASE
jgi:signal peptidase I